MLLLAQAALWLVSSDQGKDVFYAGLGFVIGILIFVRGFRILQRKRLILDTPTAKTRSAAIGLVELTGLAVGPNTITSPITQRPCFYYRTAVWKEVGSGKDRRWVQKIDERFHVPFFVEDDTGMVLIDPNGAEMDIHCDFKAEYNRSMFSSAGVPPRVAEFAGRNGVALDDNVRVEEYCLKPHNAIYVLGTLATNGHLVPTATPVPTSSGAQITQFDLGGGKAGLARSLLGLVNMNFTVNVTRTRPSMAPSGPVQLTEIDRKMAERRAQEAAAQESRQGASPAGADPAERTQAALAAVAAKDPALAAAAATFLGTSSPGAMVGGGAASPAGAAAQPAKQPVTPSQGAEQVAVAPEIREFPDQCPTVICKGKNNPAFYISWRSQKEIVSDLSTRSMLFIFGGPVLSALCLWYLLSYFRAM